MNNKEIAQKTFEHYDGKEIPKTEYYSPEYEFDLPELVYYGDTPSQTTIMDTANGLLERLQENDIGKLQF